MPRHLPGVDLPRIIDPHGFNELARVQLMAIDQNLQEILRRLTEIEGRLEVVELDGGGGGGGDGGGGGGVGGITTFSALTDTPASMAGADSLFVRVAGSALVYGNGGVGVVVHLGNAAVARPAGFDTLLWIGWVEPAGMVDNDIYLVIPEE